MMTFSLRANVVTPSHVRSLCRAVSHYKGSPQDPLGILIVYASVTLDQIPCGSPADSLRIPLELEHTLGGSAGDPQGIRGGFRPVALCSNFRGILRGSSGDSL